MRDLKCSIVVAAVMLSVLPATVRAQTVDDFFNPDVLQRVDLRLNSADWEKLKQNFRENEYYPTDVVWNGITVRNVGIRSRGFGSRSGTKPGLRVDIDRYTAAQRFPDAHGVKSFILDNLVQDPSAVRETTAMRFYAKMNIPAPRETFARLYVNSRYVGLYALIESVDKSLLARVFGSIPGPTGDDVQNDGYLFEYNYTDNWKFSYFGSDLKPYKERFSAKTHEDKTEEQKWRPIETIVRLANDLPSDRYLAELDPLLDLRAFLRYLAVQTFLGENDGFVGYDGMNNFYFYRKENSQQHVFIAWDEDNAFWGSEFPLTTRFDENVLVRKCMEVRELSDVYFAALAEAARVAETPDGSPIGWLEDQIRKQFDLIGNAISEDTFKPYSNDEHANARTFMIIFAQQRSRFVQANLPR